MLESAQAGLSWITILRKREGYRKAFCDFDAERVARMTDEDVERLMHTNGIVKNRLKIKASITNARLFLDLQKEFGSFYDYTLSFFPDRKPIINTFRSLGEIPVSSPESDAMNKNMKKGIQNLRVHDLLRPPAGRGVYQRSPDRLHLPERRRRATVIGPPTGNSSRCPTTGGCRRGPHRPARRPALRTARGPKWPWSRGKAAAGSLFRSRCSAPCYG